MFQPRDGVGVAGFLGGQAALRSPSSWRSQTSIRFQLAKFWLTSFTSLAWGPASPPHARCALGLLESDAARRCSRSSLPPSLAAAGAPSLPSHQRRFASARFQLRAAPALPDDEFQDAAGKEQAVVFELGKDIVRTTLSILEARTGKKIQYQDDEARKSGKGGL
jgi:hypothetical protein